MKNKEENYRIECLQKYGKSALSFLTLSDSLSIFRGKWDGYIAYREFLKTAVVLGDPIVPTESLRQAVRDLKDEFSSKKVHICLVACTEKVINVLRQEGFKGIYVGCEAIVDLRKFNISGNKKWCIRSSVNYAKRNGMAVEEYLYTSKRDDKLENEIKKVSEEWIRRKMTPVYSFAFGLIDFEKNKTRYFVCKHENEVVGFITYYPILATNNYYLDLQRRGRDAPRGTMDFLMVKTFEMLNREGIEKIHIGLAPLSFQTMENNRNTRITNALFFALKPFFEFIYPVKTEFQFKNKFATDWEPNYMFYYPQISLRLILSFFRAFYNGEIMSLIFHKTKCLIKYRSSRTR